MVCALFASVFPLWVLGIDSRALGGGRRILKRTSTLDPHAVITY
jgi:hypothetical protein